MIAEQFLQFFRPLPEPAFLVCGDGRILAANGACAEMLNMPHQEMTGRSLFDLAVNPAEKLRRYLGACSRSGQMVLGSIDLQTADGHVVPCRSEGAVIRRWSRRHPAEVLLRLKPKGATSKRFLLLNRKIDQLAKEIVTRREAETEREKLLIREQMARNDAEAASRAKDEFLATLSHELRTPLNAILGWASLLRHRKLNEALRDHAVEIIERNGRMQAQIIGDLLDTARIITGKLHLNLQPTDFRAIIEATYDSLKPAADAKVIHIDLNLDPHAGLITCDPGRIQQVIWNLLTNAIKFTPRGGHVRVSLERAGSQEILRVSDSGHGISREFLPHVFERFSQAESSSARQYGGLGLGLAIVRHLVELHGGDVQAESPGIGRGAVFTIRIPLSEPADAFQPQTERSVAAALASGPVNGNQVACLAGLRILLVEREAISRDFIASVLRMNGAHVEVAGSDAEVLSMTDSVKPDIVISDMSTVTTPCDQLPEDSAAAPANARLCLLAADSEMELDKPVDPAELISAVASLAGRSEL